MKVIFFILFLALLKFCLNAINSSNLITSNNKFKIIKCLELTGTGREDIFKINNPSFQWKYKNKWYDIAVSDKGSAKDWKVLFKKSEINLYNNVTKWSRTIDLKEMSAIMNFPTGEKYVYKCNYIKN